MKLSDFSFDLPEELIAQHPPTVRGQSRLLDCSHYSENPQLADRQFQEVVNLLQPADCLVINNTKVIKARLYGQKKTGGQVEVMVERLYSPTEFCAMVRANRTPKVGQILLLEGNTEIQLKARQGILFQFEVIRSDIGLGRLLEQHGSLPLPPYIQHNATEQDEQRYQTVFAQEEGAVAAPTAGLHFTKPLIQAIRDRGVQILEVTLHVGAGTFLPVKEDDISKHEMHHERFHIPGQVVENLIQAKKNGGRIVCVGTTSLRSLEAWATETDLNLGTPSGLAKAREFIKSGYKSDTNLFITPGYTFKVTDCLITNFHLPNSTLLMLVSAFANKPLIDMAYRHAVKNKYRFFSYGDAMWLNRACTPLPNH